MDEGLFSVWQIFEPTLAKLWCFWQPFNFVHGQILKNNVAIWSHCLWVQLQMQIYLGLEMSTMLLIIQ